MTYFSIYDRLRLVALLKSARRAAFSCTGDQSIRDALHLATEALEQCIESEAYLPSALEAHVEFLIEKSVGRKQEE